MGCASSSQPHGARHGRDPEEWSEPERAADSFAGGQAREAKRAAKLGRDSPEEDDELATVEDPELRKLADAADAARDEERAAKAAAGGGEPGPGPGAAAPADEQLAITDQKPLGTPEGKEASDQSLAARAPAARPLAPPLKREASLPPDVPREVGPVETLVEDASGAVHGAVKPAQAQESRAGVPASEAAAGASGADGSTDPVSATVQTESPTSAAESAASDSTSNAATKGAGLAVDATASATQAAAGGSPNNNDASAINNAHKLDASKGVAEPGAAGATRDNGHAKPAGEDLGQKILQSVLEQEKRVVKYLSAKEDAFSSWFMPAKEVVRRQSLQRAHESARKLPEDGSKRAMHRGQSSRITVPPRRAVSSLPRSTANQAARDDPANEILQNAFGGGRSTAGGAKADDAFSFSSWLIPPKTSWQRTQHLSGDARPQQRVAAPRLAAVETFGSVERPVSDSADSQPALVNPIREDFQSLARVVRSIDSPQRAAPAGIDDMRVPGFRA